MRITGLIILGFFLNLGLKAQWPKYQKPDTIHVDFKELRNDTITISGYVAECGEFGGYVDKIIVYKASNRIYGLLIKGLSCKQSLKLNETYNPYNKFMLLDSTQLKYILNYVDKFGVLAITHVGDSNAPTEFWIEYKDKKFHRWDPSGRWNEFNDLRDKIFKK